jgi:hypothetical protein
MNALARGPNRWLVSACLAALAAAAVAVLFVHTTVTVSTLRQPTAKPPITLGRGRSDELAMRDLTPLFLPTPFNAAPRSAAPAEPGRAFFDHDPGQHTLFAEENPGLHLPPVVAAPREPSAAVTLPPPPLSAGIGRSNLTIAPLAATGGRIDVYAAGESQALIGVALPLEAAPSSIGKTGSWQPLEFAAAINAAGLVDSLVLTRGSGSEDVDAHFRNYLASRFRLGDRLPPGFYRVVVAP